MQDVCDEDICREIADLGNDTAHAITGRVVDELSAQPISGVTIELRKARKLGRGRPVATARTDQAGEFLIAIEWEADTPAELTVAHADYCARAMRVEIPCTLEILLHPVVTVFGEIRHGNSPVPFAEVRIGHAATGLAARFAGAARLARYSEETKVTADELGCYRVTVPYETISVTASAPGFVVNCKSVEVLQPLVRVDLDLQPGLSLLGTVESAAGPLEGATILLTSAGGDRLLECQSRADGSFAVAALPAGRLTIDVRKSGYQPRTVQCQPGDQGVAIKLSAMGVIRGTVVHDLSGLPLQDVAIAAMSDAGLRFLAGCLVESGRVRGNGEFEVQVEPGTWRLAAATSTRAPSYSGDLEVRPGTVLEGVQLRLSAGSSLTGRVVDEAGRPISGAKILATSGVHAIYDDGPRRNFSSAFQRIAKTDATGSFLLSALADESLDLQVSQDEHLELRMSVEPGPHAGCRLGEIEMAAAGSIRGSVVMQETASAGSDLRVTACKGGETREVKVRKGQFLLGGLCPGTWRVSTSTLSRHELTVEVRPGEEAVVTLMVP